MTISINDLECGKFFTTNGKDIWKIESYYTVPTWTLVNLETGEKNSFGLGGLISENFVKIDMPIVKRPDDGRD